MAKKYLFYVKIEHFLNSQEHIHITDKLTLDAANLSVPA